MFKSLTKRIARLLLGEYQIYRIYTRARTDNRQQAESPLTEFEFSGIDQRQMESSTDEAIRSRAWYLGKDSNAFGCLKDGKIVGVCFYWHGERYRAERNFWPLASNEAKLVEIFTLPEMRGKGAGKSLIAYAENEMFARGYRSLFARIWHSNTPSIKAFENAGWQHLATIVELHLLGIGRPIRLKFKPH